MPHDEVSRHIANLCYLDDDHYPFQKVLEVDVDDKFLSIIKNLSVRAPFGWVVRTASGVLSYSRHDSSYFLFLYRNAAVPTWVVYYKVVIDSNEIESINASVIRSINWMNTAYGIALIAKELGIENEFVDEFIKKYESTINLAEELTWDKLTTDEIQELAKLYRMVKKSVEKHVKKGVSESRR